MSNYQTQLKVTIQTTQKKSIFINYHPHIKHTHYHIELLLFFVDGIILYDTDKNNYISTKREETGKLVPKFWEKSDNFLMSFFLLKKRTRTTLQLEPIMKPKIGSNTSVYTICIYRYSNNIYRFQFNGKRRALYSMHLSYLIKYFTFQSQELFTESTFELVGLYPL